MRWSVPACEVLAARRLGALGDRWLHVRSVGNKFEEWGGVQRLGQAVGAAAWLHDVGYAPELRVTGFRPLDGAPHQPVEVRWLGVTSGPELR